MAAPAAARTTSFQAPPKAIRGSTPRPHEVDCQYGYTHGRVLRF